MTIMKNMQAQIEELLPKYMQIWHKHQVITTKTIALSWCKGDKEHVYVTNV